jgi:hypothetical protein
MVSNETARQPSTFHPQTLPPPHDTPMKANPHSQDFTASVPAPAKAFAPGRPAARSTAAPRNPAACCPARRTADSHDPRSPSAGRPATSRLFHNVHRRGLLGYGSLWWLGIRGPIADPYDSARDTVPQLQPKRSRHWNCTIGRPVAPSARPRRALPENTDRWLPCPWPRLPSPPWRRRPPSRPGVSARRPDPWCRPCPRRWAA